MFAKIKQLFRRNPPAPGSEPFVEQALRTMYHKGIEKGKADAQPPQINHCLEVEHQHIPLFRSAKGVYVCPICTNWRQAPSESRTDALQQPLRPMKAWRKQHAPEKQDAPAVPIVPRPELYQWP